jgi:hypothetical protein
MGDLATPDIAALKAAILAALEAGLSTPSTCPTGAHAEAALRPSGESLEGGCIACAQPDDGQKPLAQKQRSRGGAPSGNTNALVHGRYSRAATERRREARAILRAAVLVLRAMGGYAYRTRVKRLRPDQWRHVPSAWWPYLQNPTSPAWARTASL